MDCLFCKIAAKEIPASIVFEDDKVVAFRDLNPQAPKHVLIIPKKHIATIDDLEEVDIGLVGQMVFTAKKIATDEGISQSGYRLIFNIKSDGGQQVYHIHLHMVGGRQMNWPPG